MKGAQHSDKEASVSSFQSNQKVNGVHPHFYVVNCHNNPYGSGYKQCLSPPFRHFPYWNQEINLDSGYYGNITRSSLTMLGASLKVLYSQSILLLVKGCMMPCCTVQNNSSCPTTFNILEMIYSLTYMYISSNFREQSFFDDSPSKQNLSFEDYEEAVQKKC